jgi:hypothetical protein
MSFRLSRGAAALVIVATVAAISVFFISQRHDVSPSQPLPAMRSHCIGRLLVDLPADIEPAGDVELYYGLGHDFKTVKFEPLKMQAAQPDFDAAVARRIAQLTEDGEDRTPSKNKLAATRRIDDRTALIRAHEDPVMQGYFTAEIIFLRGRTVGRLTQSVFKQDRPEDIEAHLLDIVGHVAPVADADHAGTGTCLGGVVIDAGQDGEVFTLGMRSSAHPDMVIEISSNSIVAEDDGGLLKRVDGKAPLLASLGVTSHTLRRGKVSLSQRPAEELIDSAKDHDKTVRLFDIETTLAKPSSFAAPQLHIHMSMGGQVPNGDYVDASLPEGDSLALWDAIVRSVRVRPGST